MKQCEKVIKRAGFTILLLFGIMMVACSSTHKLAITEAQAALAGIDRYVADTISISDLDSLPAPVRRYLLKTGIVGKERVRTFRGKFSGRMKLGGEKAGWTKVSVEQYSTVDTNLTRIFYIKSTMFGIIPIVGRDKYENGHGNMLIRVCDLFTVVNQTGPAMDKSELVTFLNDMSMVPSAMLNKKILWMPLSDTSACATIFDRGLKVSGIFFFSKDGDLVNFVTSDRTYDDGRGDVRKADWWTPFSHHRDFHGVRVPAEGKAVWDFGNRKFEYARFTIKNIEYNRFTTHR